MFYRRKIMIEVASLRYGVIFKKAFCQPHIFSAFATAFTASPYTQV
jgi:hypothetical protein